MKKPAIDGEARVSPCLLVDSIEEELNFLDAVFGAKTTKSRSLHHNSMWQAEARIGNTVIKVGLAQDQEAACRSTVCVRTTDVDGTFARAMREGASPIGEPAQDTAGQREAGFRDPQGNVWWIRQAAILPSNQEVQKRLAGQRKKRM